MSRSGIQVSFSNIPSGWPRTDTRVGTDELGAWIVIKMSIPRAMGHFIEMPLSSIAPTTISSYHARPGPPAHTDFRKLVVFKDPASPANIFIAYTPVQPDFATLGSFGSIADVAKTIVPSGRGACACVCGYVAIGIDRYTGGVVGLSVVESLTACATRSRNATGRGRREEPAAQVRVAQGVLHV